MSATTTKAPVPVDQETRPWPYDLARTTGTECTPLLAAILAGGTVQQIAASRDSDFDSVEGHLRSGEYRLDREDRMLDSVMLWVYPAGLPGPYHEAKDGSVKEHGLLVTAERGAKVQDVMLAVKDAFVEEGTAHVHVPAV
ncbi:hypothetical protein DAEQUDRAFT_726109 [Daedalea quercina L-15889]|uniref:Uncharacterized protein n=1 Tax=Daedalea quercina L-15889 TaxID=1314783 RepID=A0A165QQS6_9APHY|nr:hypothetical protein DAEQUDRAFT_726109 [Daedalea quercina L-15889]